MMLDLVKFRKPDVAGTVQATIGGKLAALVSDIDIDSKITPYNTAVTNIASEVLGKEYRRKKPWATRDVLDLCDERKDLKKR